MNIEHMPELHRVVGQPFATVLMAVVRTGLYVIFKQPDCAEQSAWNRAGESAAGATPTAGIG